LAEIEKECARKNFSFAEYEENERTWKNCKIGSTVFKPVITRGLSGTGDC